MKISDKCFASPSQPEIASENDYYPFGMVMPGRNYNGGNYRFGFNSQEKVDEISGAGNHNTALFWEYDTRLGRRWNQDPKPNPAISNYVVFTNNPILYNDLNGDSIKLGNLYDKDSKGTYKNAEKIAAFEAFASTKEGNKYIIDRAQKGFVLEGAFMKSLKINTKAEGRQSKNGIDIEFNIDNIGDEARTDDKIGIDGRLKLNFTIDIIYDKTKSFRDNVLNDVDDFSHESLLHGDLREQLFLNSDFKTNPFSHSNESLFSSKYGKGEGLSILQQVQNFNIKLNDGRIKYSNEYLWMNIMMPGLGYSLQPNIQK